MIAEESPVLDVLFVDASGPKHCTAWELQHYPCLI
jgi:hypothetical protein